LRANAEQCKKRNISAILMSLGESYVGVYTAGCANRLKAARTIARRADVSVESLAAQLNLYTSPF
jgi:hypothetical protein